MRTSHWFALPFAGLFMYGYLYVAARLIFEQAVSRRDSLAAASDRGIEVDSSGMARAA
jgi:hypothetical protein